MTADWAVEAAAEASQGNPWGNDDLMDVNADQDDWSEDHRALRLTSILITDVGHAGAFETASTVATSQQNGAQAMWEDAFTTSAPAGAIC